MTTAKNTMEDRSGISDAQRLADEDETAILMHRHLMTTSFEEGVMKGRERGREGLRIAVQAMCTFLGIQLDSAQAARIAELDVEQLSRVVRLLESERKWPETI